MDINYRILSVSEADHSIVVRYWTDKLSEISLCNEYGRDGKPIITDNGWPTRCRTDYSITFYDNRIPSEEAIVEIIKNHAPVDWLVMKEGIEDTNIATSLDAAVNLMGKKMTFTPGL